MARSFPPDEDLLEGDDRIPDGPPYRLDWAVDPRVLRNLVWAYPEDEFPELDSMSELFERAASDVARQRMQGDGPADVSPMPGKSDD
jgi:hypothetical protein